MKNSQTVIRSILGTADVDIRPLAYAVDAAVELMFRQGIPEDDIAVIKELYAKAAERPRPAAQNHPCAQRDDFLSGLPGLLGNTVFPGDGGRENSAFFSSGEPKTSQFQKKKEGLRGKDTSLFYFYNERTEESVTGNPQKFLQSFWEQSIKSAER